MADPKQSGDDKCDGDEYRRLLAHAKGYLPFLRIIINSENLDIQEDHKDKLRSLYDMVDAQRLSGSKLKSCQSVFCSLYAKYHKILSDDQRRALSNTRHNNVKSSSEENNISRSTDVKSISKESDQKPTSKSESPSKTSFLDVVENEIQNKKQDSIENDCKLGNESTLKNEELGVFTLTVKAIDVINKCDDVPSSSKVAQNVFNDLSNDCKTAISKQISKNINFDDIDVNLVTKMVQRISHGISDSIEPPPLPPAEILGLGLSKDLVESNVKTIDSFGNSKVSKPFSEELQHTSKCVSSNYTNVREKLNGEITKIHKIGLSGEPKQKVISALKPGTLRDLENSKIISSSLHMESLRPVVKTNESFKPVALTNVNNRYKLPFPELNDRDPRKKNNLILNSECSINPIQLSSSTNLQILTAIPKAPNCSSEPISSLLPMDVSLPLPSLILESKSQEITSHCSKSNFPQQELPHTTVPFYPGQVFNKIFNGGYPSTHNQYRYSNNGSNYDTHQNDTYPYYNSNQSHVKSAHHDESSYFKSSNRCHNEQLPRRDPRLPKSDKNSFKPMYRSFKEYKEAKYGKERSNSREPASSARGSDNYRGHILEKDKVKQIDKTKTDIKNNNSYNNLGTITDKAASIKGFKIPKVKRKEEEVCNNKQKNEKVADNREKYRISETSRDNNSDKYKKSETCNSIADKCTNNALIKDISTGNDRKTEITKNSFSDKYRNSEVVKDINIKKGLKTVSTNDKTEKTLKGDVIKIKNFEIMQNEATSDIGKELKTENSSKSVTGDSSKVLEVGAIETKSKKPKKYSKEKEFEKIVKEAVASSKEGDLLGPRTRTRNCLNNKDEKVKRYEINDHSKHNSKQSNDNDVSELLEETGHNVVSSSKDLSEIDSSTEVVCNKSQEKNIVSSNVNNSTADDNYDKMKEKLMEFLTKCDVNKLTKLLESPHIANLIEDKSDDKSTLNDEKLNTGVGKKSKKMKKKKEKKNRNNSGEKFLDNEKRNDLASSLNEGNSKNRNIDATEGANSYADVSNDDNDSNSNNSLDNLPTNQVELKSNKSKRYGNFTILEDKSNIKLKDIKIVLSKCDKEREDEVSRVNRTKSQLEQVSQNKYNEEPQSVDSGFEITCKIIPEEKEKFGYKKMESLTKSGLDNLKKIPEKPSGETQSHCEDDLIKPNSKITETENNVTVNSKSSKKPRSKSSELDKLHAYTSEMYDCDAILNISNVRHCRTNKQVDYSDTGLVFAKKSNASSSVNKLNCKKKFDEDFEEKSKSTKTPSKLFKKSVNKNFNAKASKNNVMLVKKKSYAKSKAKKQLNKRKSKFSTECGNEKTAEVLPKILTENDFKDKSYFQNANNWLECKFCIYSDNGLNIVRHYVEQHREEEVLASRLPKDCAENLINESLKENFGFLNSEDMKLTRSSVNNVFTCVFCQLVINNIIQFYDHITSHTGEYRYKCKMCEQVHSCVIDLEKHTSEHADYDRTNGISHLLRSCPSGQVFGYLCSFCYYVQLDYNNMVKHMEKRHCDEDKRFNSHWTVIRVNMSCVKDSYENVVVDYTNLVGCLPPVSNQPACQIISLTHDVEDKMPLSVSQLKNETLKNLNGNAESVLFDEPPLEISKVIPHLSTKQTNFTSHENEPQISTVDFGANYTMKDDCQMLTVAELSCVLVDQVLMFKCCVLSCSDHPYSTVNLTEFVKHIELSHQHTVWNRKCTQCRVKVEKVSDDCLVIKDALKHLISHHLVEKTCEEIDTLPVENMVEKQNASIPCQYDVENVPIRKEMPSKPLIRCVALDNLIQPSKKAISAMTCDSSSINKAISVPDSGANGDVENLIIYNVRSVPVSDFNRNEFSVVANDNLSTNETLSVPNSNDNNIDTTEQFIPENVNENYEQFNHITSDNVLEELPDNPTNSNQLDDGISNIRIEDIRSLKKKKAVKKRAPRKILSTSNDNFNVHIRCVMSPEGSKRNLQKTVCEDGHFIVNDGKLFNGYNYKLVDEYKKCYSKQVKDLPINMLKTRLALNEMMSLPRMLDLFKCMDKSCTKIFTQKELFILHMKLHFSNAEKKNKNQVNNTEYFRKCAYCYRTFDDEHSLANHIAEQYTYCRYFCSYCFYRAYTPTHVLIHIKHTHENAKSKVIKLEYEENFNESQTEVSKAVDYSKFVLPFNCNIGSCKFSSYLSEDYTSHLTQEHQQCSSYCCYLCEEKNNSFIAIQPNQIVDHFKIHGINKYQCVFCLFATGSAYPMLIHISMEHFEYNPICLERIPWEDSIEKSLTNMRITRLTVPIDNGVLETVSLPPGNSSLSVTAPKKSKKRDFKRSDVITAAMESAQILENVQAPDTIVINVPDSTQFTDNNTNYTSDISSEFIMLDDVVNSKKDTAKVAVLSESENSIRKPQSHDDNSVIIIDDEDDLSFNSASNNEENIKHTNKQKSSVQKSSSGPNKCKRLAWPVVPLDILFYCKACNINLQDGKGYLHHLNTCSSLMLNGRQCPFCTKQFTSDFNVTEHIKLHGPDRFSCSSCDFRAPSKHAIEHHMKMDHNILNFDFVPIEAALNDPDKDEFVVHEDLTNSKKHCIRQNLYTCSLCKYIGRNHRSIVLHMQDTHLLSHWDIRVLYDASPSNNYTQHYIVMKSTNGASVSNSQEPNENVKRKHSSDHSNNASKKIKVDKARLSFSPNTIDNIPNNHIFSQDIDCSLCSYHTKVRSNLILHLQKHKEGQENITKEIVNPVPSMGKPDLMFDKMLNFAASSMEAMNTERMKICEINKKIVEVSSKDYSNVGLYPKFVDKKELFKCSICFANFLNLDMLKTHVSVIHPYYSYYRCPHCPCDKKDIDFNKIEYHLMHHSENLFGCQYCDYIDFNRTEMRTHMRKNHLLEVTSAHQSNIIVIRQTKLEDDSLERSICQDQSSEAEWICNLCSSDVKYTKSDIKSHIFADHNVLKMFKCPLCHFEHDNNDGNVFEDHYRVEHPSVAVQCLTVCEKVTYIQESPSKRRCVTSTPIQLEQQALESIEPSIVPRACRGIPVESAGKTTYNKSRVGTKSPKANVKSSPVKQKTFTDNFSVLDSLGNLTASGLFSCPRCNMFETIDIVDFRVHLCNDVNYKTWKCMNCFEISDSPKKMAWHVKKHGDGSKYEKIENAEKLNWVNDVIKHQCALKEKFDNRMNVNRKEQEGKFVTDDKNLLKLSLRKKNCEGKKKALGSQAIISASTSKQLSNTIEVISLLDESDSE